MWISLALFDTDKSRFRFRNLTKEQGENTQILDSWFPGICVCLWADVGTNGNRSRLVAPLCEYG